MFPQKGEFKAQTQSLGPGGVGWYCLSLSGPATIMVADTVSKVPPIRVQDRPLFCGHGHGEILFIHSRMIYLLSTYL